MKKYLVIALAAVAIQAQSATINWGLGADVYLIKVGTDYSTAILADNASAPQVAAGSYLALVYIGNGVESFDIADITSDSVVASAPYKIDTSMGGVDYDPFQTTTLVNDLTKYADGSSFAVVWFDAGRSKFDYIYSIDDGSPFNTKDAYAVEVVSDMTRGSADITPALFTQGYGGVLAVPEPSTAMLALAGLALLIKRRKA